MAFLENSSAVVFFFFDGILMLGYTFRLESRTNPVLDALDLF